MTAGLHEGLSQPQPVPLHGPPAEGGASSPVPGGESRLRALCAEIQAITSAAADEPPPLSWAAPSLAKSGKQPNVPSGAVGCFRVYPGAAEGGGAVLYCSLSALLPAAEGDAGRSWSDAAPRCYGDARRRAILAAFETEWDAAAEAAGHGRIVAVLNAKGALRRSPIAVLQQLSLLAAARSQLCRLVVYPAPPRVERAARDALRLIDAGRVTDSAAVVFANSAAEVLDAVGGDSPGAWRDRRDLPEELRCADSTGAQRLRSQGRHAHGSGSQVTPWYPAGVNLGSVTLDEELADFAAFIIASPAERTRRLALRGLVHSAVAAAADGATVKVVGPEAHGLVAPGEPLLLSAEGVCEMATGEAAIRAAGLHIVPWAAGPCGGVAALAPCGTRVELLWGPVIAADARRGIADVRRWVQEFSPGASTAYLVLRQVLSQSVSTAGCIGPDTLLMMVLHTCRRVLATAAPNRARRGPRRGRPSAEPQGPPVHACVALNAERVLRAFLSLFAAGGSFDFSAHSVDPRQGCPVAKQHPEDPLSVLGPSCALNLAIGCSQVQLGLIQQQLLYLRHALARADSKLASAAGNGPHSNPARHTPLSSIVCHDHLWQLRDKEAAPRRWPVVSIN
eukprot:TRINITY_DN12871_c0_g1_i2.p1 TRINITY_DN12871_c0_g1~~TRINITY_DN12871_c0_g1_i2.p1  ORF type:complete len:649 (+),score=136.15 TRINITY_DN12871_c0_g1_i2:86-1948(+)